MRFPMSILGCLICVYYANVAAAQPTTDTPAPPPAPTPAPVVEAPPAAPPPSAPPPTGAAPTSPEAPATAPPAGADRKWYDIVNLGAFVDTYYSQNWRRPRPNGGANLYQPYTPNTGFSLAWVGVDASVDPDPVGATLQLRFGPSVPNLALGDFAIPGGIGFVQNGYVSWKPGGKDGKLTLIMGKFDTVYGAEVAQSHLNINYTRGYLYNLAQPFFHTGLRADVQVTDMIGLKLLAVNGWNNTIDNNRGKSFGAQITAAPAEGVSLGVGYMGGPEESDVNAVTCGATETWTGNGCIPAAPGAPTGGSGNVRNVGADGRWRHLVDAVADVTIAKQLRIVVNGDYVMQTISVGGTDATARWYGASLLTRIAITDTFGVGGRGEIVRDDDGQITAPNTAPLTLYTGTLTLDFAPHKMLVIRLDNRIDAADAAVFQTGLRDIDKTQLTSTLGVVAKTN